MQFSILTVVSLSLLIPSISASFSLSTLEALPDDQVTLGCLNAYNADIKSCSNTQIASGNCNELCEEDLEEHSKKVILACRQAFVGMDTLLRKTLDGGLVATLCNGKPKEVPEDGQSNEEGEEQQEEEEPAATSVVFESSMVVTLPTTTAITDIQVDDGPTPTSPAGNDNADPTKTADADSEEEDTGTGAGGDPFSSNSSEEEGGEEQAGDDSAAGRIGVSGGMLGVVALLLSAWVM